jgi:two-component system, response regulator, stage 0 sporulation protein A
MEQFVKDREYRSKEQTFSLLYSLGMPVHLKGTVYLAEAAALLGRDLFSRPLLTKEVYPEIARKYRTSSASVERNMRSAIEALWKKRNIDSKKHTNAEFLAYLCMNAEKEDIFPLL